MLIQSNANCQHKPRTSRRLRFLLSMAITCLLFACCSYLPCTASLVLFLFPAYLLNDALCMTNTFINSYAPE